MLCSLRSQSWKLCRATAHVFRGSNDSGIRSLVLSTSLQSSDTQSVFVNLFVYAGQTFCDCSVSVCMGDDTKVAVGPCSIAWQYFYSWK